MCQKKPYYITTPIYYPSGNPHIGHCYTTVACDSIARYRRMQGYDVMFLTGTDEHGLKIEQKAAEKGVTPKEYVDEVVKTFKSLWNFMNVDYDRYIRTTDDYHIKTVQKIFKELYDKGYIYKGEYSGKYCTPCESFWTESQLVDGKCPECGREVTEAKEEAYFFKMSPFADRIEKLLTETDYLQPKTRATELVNNFIKPGLEDLCVSRTTFKWGIPVTFDDKHVIYVWIDALSNYISALGFYNDAYNDFDKFWPADVHMVAKDIMRFHAIIWPAMLMALDLPLPKHLAVHGWITFNGQKMSKSLGNGIDPLEVIEKYGADTLRFMLITGNTPGNDMRFYWERVEATRNFANKIWNASRFALMNMEGYDAEAKQAPYTLADQWILSRLQHTVKDVTELLGRFELGEAGRLIYDFIWSEVCDWYIELAKPRLYNKEDPEARATAQHVLAEVLTSAMKLLHPYMPFITEEIYQCLPHESNSIMIAPWPIVDERLFDDKAETGMTAIMESIKAIRNMRAEVNAAPGKKVPAILLVNAELREIVEANKNYINLMGSIDELIIDDIGAGKPENAMAAVIAGIEVYLPLAGLIDVEKETQRLNKELESMDKEIKRVTGKLNNAGFLAKAPADVVEKEKAKAEELSGKMEAVKERLTYLATLK